MSDQCFDVAHLGHVELLSHRPQESLDFFVNVYGLTESGRDGDSVYLRAWDDYEFHINNKSYDVAVAEDRSGARGRFHHVTYAVDQREDVLRAADIFLENDVFIETGPHKHAIQGTFFLYVYEPAGNRVEVANAGARLILQPDWQAITWTEAERRKGQAWGLKTIDSFHTHGTPPVEEGGPDDQDRQ